VNPHQTAESPKRSVGPVADLGVGIFDGVGNSIGALIGGYLARPIVDIDTPGSLGLHL